MDNILQAMVNFLIISVKLALIWKTLITIIGFVDAIDHQNWQVKNRKKLNSWRILNGKVNCYVLICMMFHICRFSVLTKCSVHTRYVYLGPESVSWLWFAFNWVLIGFFLSGGCWILYEGPTLLSQIAVKLLECQSRCCLHFFVLKYT